MREKRREGTALARIFLSTYELERGFCILSQTPTPTRTPQPKISSISSLRPLGRGGRAVGRGADKAPLRSQARQDCRDRRFEKISLRLRGNRTRRGYAEPNPNSKPNFPNCMLHARCLLKTESRAKAAAGLLLAGTVLTR